MTWEHIEALLPLTIVGLTAVTVMLVISFWRSQTLAALLTLAGLVVAFGFTCHSWTLAPRDIDSILLIDRFGLFYLGLILCTSIAVTILAHPYLATFRMERSEFYILLLLATDGAAILATSSHFVSLFLGLELLSVSLYVMVAYVFMRETALEGGLKYLFLAAVTSAFLLFGMALLYAEFGTMTFAGLAAGLRETEITREPLILAGLVLIVVGVGFKLSIVPFHMWTPDIYEGAPAPVAGYLATVSKGAVLAVVLRFALELDLQANAAMFRVFALIAALTMFTGNLLALRQANLKRLLAYSSIAHMGYVLVAFLAGGHLGVQAVTFYLVTYFITTLGAFGVVGFLSAHGREADSFADYRGLFWRRPFTAAAFTAMLFSLAGLPLTAGFIGKFYLLFAAVDGELWALVLMLVVNSAIGLYYYLRVVVTMFAAADPPATPLPSVVHRTSTASVLGVLTFLLVAIGLFPQPVLRLIELVTLTLAP